jgi:hypothetical protein
VLSPNFLAALEAASLAANEVLTDPPAMTRNVTEWAKNQACWNRVKGLEIRWPEDWLDELLTGADQKDEKRSAVKDQRVLNGIEAQAAVVKAGGQFWRAAHSWGTARKLLTPMEAGILEVAAALPDRVPSDRQSLRAVDALRKLHSEGYQQGLDMV